MNEQKRRPGDPYEVGFGKPPKRRRFRKGRSGNPYGRPPKKPDIYAGLRSVLHEYVTVTVQGEEQQATVQEALLLCLRHQALRGEAWAFKLFQRVLDAIPEGMSEYDRIELEVGVFRSMELLRLMAGISEHEEMDLTAEQKENGDAE